MKFLFCLLNLLFFDVLFTVARLDLESSSTSRRNSVSFFKTGFHSGEGKRRNEFAEWHVAWLAEWHNYAEFNIRRSFSKK